MSFVRADLFAGASTNILKKHTHKCAAHSSSCDVRSFLPEISQSTPPRRRAAMLAQTRPAVLLLTLEKVGTDLCRELIMT